MEERTAVLTYAVRGRVVLKYCGQLMLMLMLLTLVPAGVALLSGEWMPAQRYGILCCGLLLAGAALARLPAPSRIQSNEALTITALAFVLSPLLMSWPLMAIGISFTDALFEAISGVTTTGLSVVGNIEQRSSVFLFARAWMQWYGGLGIVVFSVAILLNHHIALRRLITPDTEGMLTTTRVYTRRVFTVYIVLTLAGFIILLLLLGNGFSAIVYTLAAVSTGGFAPLNSSLGDLSLPAQYGISLLGLCGAIPLIFYYRLTRGDWREIYSDTEVRILVGFTLGLSLLLTLSLITLSGFDWRDAIHHGTLLAISAQTTTGFASLDVGSLEGLTLGFMIFAMVIGGTAGSTAGGFKILRLLIMWSMIRLLIQRTAMTAHAVSDPRLGDKILEQEEIERALMLIILFLMVVGISWLIFLAYGFDPLQALFEVASAAGTVGLSSGVTSHELDPFLKVVLCVNMLLGRVEIIAVLVVLYPGTWLGKRVE